jgi:hypothetical protein
MPSASAPAASDASPMIGPDALLPVKGNDSLGVPVAVRDSDTVVGAFVDATLEPSVLTVGG